MILKKKYTGNMASLIMESVNMVLGKDISCLEW